MPGQAGLFLSAVTSATLLPGSSEAVFTLLLLKNHAWLSCLIVASVGNWLGGMTSYGLGRLGRWSWLEILGVRKIELRRFQQWIIRWGSLVGLLAWLPFVGDILMVGLGYFRMSILAVAVFTFIGRLLRYGFIAYVTLILKG